MDGAVVVAEVLEMKDSIGLNALTGQYVDLLKDGVIDPAKVVKAALKNAASIAGLLLTMNTMVADIKEKKEPVADSVS
jgi:chaperonin GroEL